MYFAFGRSLHIKDYSLAPIKNNRRMLMGMAERWPGPLYRGSCLKGVLIIYNITLTLVLVHLNDWLINRGLPLNGT